MNTSFFLVNDRYKVTKNILQLALGLEIFFHPDEMFFGKPEGGYERKRNHKGRDQKSVLQCKMFGDCRGILFVQIVRINELVDDAEDGDADGTAQLLKQAVHGGSGRRLFAGNGV